MDKLLAALAVGVIIVLLTLLFIKLGWYLFVVPVFGLPDLTWLQAFGFSLLASTFKSSGIGKKG